MESKYRIDSPTFDDIYEQVYPPDYEIVDEVIKKSSDKEEFLKWMTPEEIAKYHAQHGTEFFRLRFNLRAPRHEGEEIIMAYLSRHISKDEYESQIQEYVKKPLSLEFVEVLEREMERLADFYSQFRNIPEQIVLDQHGKYPCSEWEPIASYYARELIRGFTCFVRDQRTHLLPELNDLRSEAGLGICRVGDRTNNTAYLLFLDVTSTLAKVWLGCVDTAEKSRVDPRYLYQTTASELFAEVCKDKYPLPQDLMTVFYEELDAVKMQLRKKQQKPTVMAVSVVSPVDVNILNTDEPSSDPDDSGQTPGQLQPDSSTQDKKSNRGTKTPRLSDWAVATEGNNVWWLFQKYQTQWQQSCRIEIPSGHAESLMQLLAQNEGAISKDEARKALFSDRTGQSFQKQSRAITYALAKAKSAIRKKIADIGRYQLNDVDNPIPQVNPGWRAKIEIGYAIKSDEGRLEFRLRSQMS